MAPGADAEPAAGRCGEAGGQAARSHRAGSRSPDIEFARAKVNLFLHVLGRRADGYHLLDSLAVFPEVGDRLRLQPGCGELRVAVTGSFAAVTPAGDANLVLRAGRALAAAAGIAPGGRLTLEKHLPVAAGLGGGSADAAAALRLLRGAWHVSSARVDLAALALSLGADVPVCLGSRPARMQGIGEILRPAPGLPACGLVLVNPGQAVPTADIFRARHAPDSAPADLPDRWASATAMARGLRRLRNDLEPAAITLCPAIREVLATIAALPGCLLARMSGSGATCYGLFATPAAAHEAARSITVSGWWCWGGGLRQSGAQAARSHSCASVGNAGPTAASTRA